MKAHLVTAAIVLGGIYAYHSGLLNSIPLFAGPKK